MMGSMSTRKSSNSLLDKRRFSRAVMPQPIASRRPSSEASPGCRSPTRLMPSLISFATRSTRLVRPEARTRRLDPEQRDAPAPVPYAKLRPVPVSRPFAGGVTQLAGLSRAFSLPSLRRTKAVRDRATRAVDRVRPMKRAARAGAFTHCATVTKHRRTYSITTAVCSGECDTASHPVTARSVDAAHQPECRLGTAFSRTTCT